MCISTQRLEWFRFRWPPTILKGTVSGLRRVEREGFHQEAQEDSSHRLLIYISLFGLFHHKLSGQAVWAKDEVGLLPYAIVTDKQSRTLVKVMKTDFIHNY